MAAFALSTEPPLHSHRVAEPGRERRLAEREVCGGVGLHEHRVPRGAGTVVHARGHHRLVCRSFREPQSAKFWRNDSREVRDERGGEIAAELVDLLVVGEKEGAENERPQVTVRLSHVFRTRKVLPAALFVRIVRHGAVRVEPVRTEHEHVAHIREGSVTAEGRPAFLELGNLRGDRIRIAADIYGSVRDQERLRQFHYRHLLDGRFGGECEGENEREKEHEKPRLHKENSRDKPKSQEY